MANGPVIYLFWTSWTPMSLSIAVFLVTVVANEYILYVMQSFRWPSLPVETRDPDTTQVLLLVSDPQIPGYKEEPGFPFGTLSRWDVDRYLATTFSLAYSYAQPDIVLFLGDLMDEGSRASNSEYQDYYYRFKKIFSPASNTKKIYIPGDNDIGGEHQDRRTKKKMERFEKHFENLTGVDKFSFIDYIKMNLRTYDGPFLPKRDLADKLKKKITSPIRLLLSHETVMAKYKVELYPLLKRLYPQLILSAHWHKSNVFVCDDCMIDDEEHWSVHHLDLTWMKGYMKFNLTLNTLTEVMVPTSSYRMGEKNMGYGVAVIVLWNLRACASLCPVTSAFEIEAKFKHMCDSDASLHNICKESTGEMKYAVLWSPNRYYMVCFYICVTIFLVLINIALKLFPRVRRKYL